MHFNSAPSYIPPHPVTIKDFTRSLWSRGAVRRLSMRQQDSSHFSNTMEAVKSCCIHTFSGYYCSSDSGINYASGYTFGFRSPISGRSWSTHLSESNHWKCLLQFMAENLLQTWEPPTTFSNTQLYLWGMFERKGKKTNRSWDLSVLLKFCEPGSR